VPSLGSEYVIAFNEAKKVFKDTSADFLLEKGNEDLIVGIETPLEIELEEGKAVSFTDATPEESFHINFKENYLNSILEDNNISVKLVNFSDKSTILSPLVDVKVPINFMGKKYNSLKTITLADLKELNNKSILEHYSYIISNVVNDYRLLKDKFGNQLITFDPADTLLEKVDKIDNFLKNNSKDIVEIAYQNALSNPDLNIVSEVHYSPYKEGKNTVYRFNKTLLYYYNTAKNGTFTSNAEEAFINKLAEVNIPNDLNNILDIWKYGDSIQEQAFNLAKNLNISNSEIDPFIVNGKIQLLVTTEGAAKLNPIVAKWLHTQNLIRYGFTGLITKHEYQHPHKSKLSADTITDRQEISGRSIAMTKRMVIYPATQEFYMQGLDFGIDSEIRIAVVEDLRALSFNVSGQQDSHDAHDGSILSSSIFTYGLKKSFPGKDVADVQKLIGHAAHDISSTFIKCALFSLTNEKIRISANNSVDLDTVMYKMHSIPIEDSIDLSRNSLGNNYILEDIVTNGVYYTIKGITYQVHSFKKVSGNNYQVALVDTNTGLTKLYTTPINNLYDLWKIFGGAYSKSKVGENYEYSEASVDIVGNIVGNVKVGGRNVLKRKMIGIISANSAMKNGAVNINPTRVLLDRDSPLASFTVSSKFFGIQLDAYHVSDEAQINEVSQVVAALAQGQSSPELYLELYDAIGDIVKKQIEKFTLKNKDENGEFDLAKISKVFMEAVVNNKQLGTAKEILDVLKEDLKYNGLPISNSNFFNQFIIKVISGLSTDFISRKYRGLGAVLNPSYGMVQLYEDALGNTYFAADLLNLATAEDYPTEDIYDPHIINKMTINNVISRLFPNEDITPEQIQPLDRISINGGKEIVLNDIKEYYTVKKALLNNDLENLKKLGFIKEVIKNSISTQIKPGIEAKKAEKIISAGFESQETTFALEIKGDNRDFLLTWGRNSNKPTLWGEKQADGTYKITLEFPTNEQVQNLINKYVPVKLLQLINKWTEASKLPAGQVLDTQDKIAREIEAELKALEQPTIRQGAEELFNENPELANIGTKEQYSQYLDTIFPDSKVKDIVYHGTEKFIGDVFTKEYLGKKSFRPRKREGFYFTNKEGISIIGYAKKTVISSLINIQNPQLAKDIRDIKEYDVNNDGAISKEDTGDEFGTYEFPTFVIFEPEQIHILGSKQDIEGFKEFTKNQDTLSIKLIKNKPRDLKPSDTTWSQVIDNKITKVNIFDTDAVRLN